MDLVVLPDDLAETHRDRQLFPVGLGDAIAAGEIRLELRGFGCRETAVGEHLHERVPVVGWQQRREFPVGALPLRKGIEVDAITFVAAAHEPQGGYVSQWPMRIDRLLDLPSQVEPLTRQLAVGDEL